MIGRSQKLVAGKEQDIMVCAILFRHNILNRELLIERLEQTDIDDASRANAKINIEKVTIDYD